MHSISFGHVSVMSQAFDSMSWYINCQPPIALAFAAGGSLRNCQTTALMSNAEGLEAMRKAATCGYKPVVAAASGAAARP
jgi:hypothetical protein